MIQPSDLIPESTIEINGERYRVIGVNPPVMTVVRTKGGGLFTINISDVCGREYCKVISDENKPQENGPDPSSPPPTPAKAPSLPLDANPAD